MSAHKTSTAVAVVDKNGIPLMPTNSCRARHLLKKGRAVIYKYRPVFTIQLTDVEFVPDTGMTQPIELKMDTGYQHIGISVCSEKHEYIHRQCDLLPDEAEHHNNCSKYRRTRRNHLRYRKVRFKNRKGLISKDGLAPSIRNKRDRHVDLVRDLCEVFPITDGFIEMGQFDTQLLKAIEEGKPAPKGKDYQHGEQYGFNTLREAVFSRDEYTCQCCGRSAFKDNAVLHVHHIGFWKDIPDRSNRMANLMTVCEKCHTSKNHKPGGALYGLEPKLKGFKGATFMTAVRFSMFAMMKAACPDVVFHMTYGADTKASRSALHLKKTHANDAYAMGNFHPEHKAHCRMFRKRRRNDRILGRFRDAVYTDVRDGIEKKGSQLGCNRTKRSIPRDNPGNERIYRGHKVSRGCTGSKEQHYELRPGDTVRYSEDGRTYVVNGIQNKGCTVQLRTTRTVDTSTLQPKRVKNKTLPITAGQKLALTGRKEKHTVLSVSPDGKQAVLQWYMGVKPSSVTRISPMLGAWEPVAI